MRPVNNWLVFSLKIVAIIALLIGIFFSSFHKKGSMRVAERTPQSVYTWEQGSLRTQGPVTPNKCALTTTKCKCDLTAEKTECSFSFNFENLNSSANVKTGSTDFPAVLTTTISNDCSSDKQNKIFGCTITYKWDKSKSISKNTQILLSGTHGTQVLLNLQIEAK